MMKPIVVIGLGNILLKDEGIGVHLLNALAKEDGRFPEVEFLDMGAGGFSVLHAIAGRRAAVILDCAFMDETPGTMRRFTPDDVRSSKTLSDFSLHESDLLQVLELARRLGDAPETVIILGIQPADVSPGEGLSPTLSVMLPAYAAKIAEAIRDISNA